MSVGLVVGWRLCHGNKLEIIVRCLAEGRSVTSDFERREIVHIAKINVAYNFSFCCFTTL